MPCKQLVCLRFTSEVGRRAVEYYSHGTRRRHPIAIHRSVHRDSNKKQQVGSQQSSAAAIKCFLGQVLRKFVLSGASLVVTSVAGEFYWQKVKTSGRSPAPRWHHTVAVKPPSTLVLFGGFRSSSVRFNDLWLLDTKGDKWSQPQPGITDETDDGKPSVPSVTVGCPIFYCTVLDCSSPLS